MPPVSQAQRRFFHWAEANPSEASKKGVTPEVAKDFTSSDPGGKLPERAPKQAGGAAEQSREQRTERLDRSVTQPRGLSERLVDPIRRYLDPQRGLWGPADPTDPDDPRRAKTWQAGGAVGLGARPRYQMGGSGLGLPMSMAEPPWTRQEMRIADQVHAGGLIGGSGAGRTDQLPLAVAADSHVLPAEEVSGLGQGHSLAGARIMTMATRIGPWGTEIPQSHRVGPGPPGAGHGPPSPPPIGEYQRLQHLFNPSSTSSTSSLASEGGRRHETSILAASGEFVIPREDWLAEDEHGQVWHQAGVRTIGGGDLEEGHRRLNAMIHTIRKHHIKFLQTAPAPKN